MFKSTSVDRSHTGSAIGWAKVNTEGENTIIHRPLCIADDREVLIVDLSLLDEQGAFIATNRWQIAAFHRLGPLTEPFQHRINVEIVGHAHTISGRNG